MANKVAIVTGAAQGIGRAIALRLAQDGYLLSLNDLSRQKDHLVEVQKEAEAISTAQVPTGSQERVILVFGDVTKEEEVRGLIEQTVSALGGLEVMVANAGVCVTKPFLLTTLEDFQRVTRINLDSTFLCYKYAAEQMIKQGRGGRLIGASSIAGKQGWPFLSAYSTSKFAVRGLTQATAAELGRHGITVNAYAPGPIDTQMLRELREAVNKHAPADAGAKGVDSAAIEGDGTPEDIAGLVSYLVSPAARYVTGQSVSINGGRFFE